MSRDRDSNEMSMWFGRMALSFHQERNGETDKAVSSFIPAFLGSPWLEDVCASTILLNLYSRVSQVPRRKERRKRKEPMQLITDLVALTSQLSGQLDQLDLRFTRRYPLIGYPHR